MSEKFTFCEFFKLIEFSLELCCNTVFLKYQVHNSVSASNLNQALWVDKKQIKCVSSYAHILGFRSGPTYQEM